MSAVDVGFIVFVCVVGVVVVSVFAALIFAAGETRGRKKTHKRRDELDRDRKLRELKSAVGTLENVEIPRLKRNDDWQDDEIEKCQEEIGAIKDTLSQKKARGS